MEGGLMSSRVFKGCRALLAAAKAGTAKSTATKKGTGRSSAAAAAKTTKPSIKRPPTMARPTGILKMAPVSPILGNFLGVPESSRTDAVKKIWEYIKLHNLQNPSDKREINCDAKLKTLFEGKDKVGFLEIGKLLSRHFVKTG